MHLETIQHLRALAATHDDTVPVSKALLLDLLDSYEKSAAFPLTSGPCGGNWCVWAANKPDAYLWAFDVSQRRPVDGLITALNKHALEAQTTHPVNPVIEVNPVPSPKYLIISEERRTHGMVWFYAHNSKGYTSCTARAGRYTEAEAAAILSGTSGELSALRETDLPRLQILHHIDRGYGDNGAILKTLITHALPSATPVTPVPTPAAAPHAPHPALGASDTPHAPSSSHAPHTPAPAAE